jgi:hypothetical protein
MGLPRRLLLLLLLVAAADPPITAQAEPITDGDEVEPVRVYTNADLERFGRVGVDPTPPAPDDGAEWAFVTEFLAREHARLDAERSLELERRRVTLEEEVVARDRHRSDRYYWRPGYAFVHTGYFERKRKHRASGAATTSVGGPIVPLHARPTQALRMRAKAIRRSGADAFPSRARASRRP